MGNLVDFEKAKRNSDKKKDTQKKMKQQKNKPKQSYQSGKVNVFYVYGGILAIITLLSLLGNNF